MSYPASRLRSAGLAQALAWLAAAFVAVHASVFVAGRTLLPIAPSFTTTPGTPYYYRGPIAAGAMTIDPAGAINASFAFDAYTARTLRAGTLPFWNPYQSLGAPFLANGLSAVLYPITWLVTIVPPAWWDIVYALNWLLAAWFVVAYLRITGVDFAGALVGGAAIIGGGFFQIYFAEREVVAVAAWWPLLLYCIERTIREPGWRWRYLVTALGVYCTLSGGQPESAFISLFTVCVYGLVAVLARPGAWRQALPSLLLAGTAGLLLALPAWATFADYAFRAYSQHPAGTHVGRVHLPFESIGSYVYPWLYGPLFAASRPVPGWIWDLSPGWVPAVVLFLAMASLADTHPRWRLARRLVTAIALLIAAKIWNIWPVSLLGALPIFERVVYPRYASFLLAISLAILSGYGTVVLRDRARRLAPLATAWLLLQLAFGLLALLSVRSAVGSGRLPSQFAVFAYLGVAWAIAAPAVLLWLAKVRRVPEPAICAVAGGFILLQAAACSPGYVLVFYARMLPAMLLAAVALGLIVGYSRTAGFRPVLTAAAILSIAAVSSLAAAWKGGGLPVRHDLLSPVPPYLQAIAQWQEQRAHGRVYTFNGLPQPNFGAALGVSSLNILEALLPPGTAAFHQRYLDPNLTPLWFAGDLASGRVPGTSARQAYAANRRYFALAGARYLSSFTPAPAASEAGLDIGAGSPLYVPGLQQSLSEPHRAIQVWEDVTAAPRAFLATDVRVVSDRTVAIEQLGTIADLRRSVIVDRPVSLHAVESATADPGHLVRVDLEPNGVDIEYAAMSGGVLVLTDSHSPGWTATVNGQPTPILLVNGVFRGVVIASAGHWQVRFAYRPPHWTLFCAVALAGLTVVVTATALDGRSRVVAARREPPA